MFYFQTHQRLTIIPYMTSLYFRLGNGGKWLLMSEHNFGFPDHFDGLMQERRTSNVLAMDCTKPSIYGRRHYWQDVLFLTLMKYVMNWFGHGSVKIVKQNINKSIYYIFSCKFVYTRHVILVIHAIFCIYNFGLYLPFKSKYKSLITRVVAYI